MNTKEVARKPDAKVKIKCSSCNKNFVFEEASIIEKSLPYPYVTVVEGFMVCPYCKFESHTYYMSENLRFEVDRLRKAAGEWHDAKTVETYKKYEHYHKVYENNFKKEQVKYKEIAERRNKNGAETS